MAEAAEPTKNDVINLSQRRPERKLVENPLTWWGDTPWLLWNFNYGASRAPAPVIPPRPPRGASSMRPTARRAAPARRRSEGRGLLRVSRPRPPAVPRTPRTSRGHLARGPSPHRDHRRHRRHLGRRRRGRGPAARWPPGQRGHAVCDPRAMPSCWPHTTMYRGHSGARNRASRDRLLRSP